MGVLPLLIIQLKTSLGTELGLTTVWDDYAGHVGR